MHQVLHIFGSICQPAASASRLQPAPSEDAEAGGDGKKLRTLAGKLMGRRRSKPSEGGGGGGGDSKGGDASSTGSSLDRLSFGGHQLAREGARRCVCTLTHTVWMCVVGRSAANVGRGGVKRDSNNCRWRYR